MVQPNFHEQVIISDAPPFYDDKFFFGDIGFYVYGRFANHCFVQNIQGIIKGGYRARDLHDLINKIISFTILEVLKQFLRR